MICVQELKAQQGDINGVMRAPDGYSGYFHCAEKGLQRSWALYPLFSRSDHGEPAFLKLIWKGVS